MYLTDMCENKTKNFVLKKSMFKLHVKFQFYRADTNQKLYRFHPPPPPETNGFFKGMFFLYRFPLAVYEQPGDTAQSFGLKYVGSKDLRNVGIYGAITHQQAHYQTPVRPRRFL
jgi:hypothetical protein